MKTIKILSLLLLTTFMFASCSKDEDEDNTASVAGTTWEMTYYKYTMAGQTAIECDTKSELEELGMYFSFTLAANGDVLVDGEEDGSWVQSGSSVTVTIDGESIIMKQSGNTLTSNESAELSGVKFTETTRFTKK